MDLSGRVTPVPRHVPCAMRHVPRHAPCATPCATPCAMWPVLCRASGSLSECSQSPQCHAMSRQCHAMCHVGQCYAEQVARSVSAVSQSPRGQGSQETGLLREIFADFCSPPPRVQGLQKPACYIFLQGWEALRGAGKACHG